MHRKLFLVTFFLIISSFYNTANAQNNRENIKSIDNRELKLSLNNIQDTVFQLSKKYLVVVAEVERSDTIYERKIESAIIRNLKANRDKILLIYMNKLEGGHSKMFMIGKGEVSMPLVKGMGYNEADFIERVYKECEY